MTRFQITIDVIWGAAFAGGFYMGAKGLILYKNLMHTKLIKGKWMHAARLAELGALEENTKDSSIKNQAHKTVIYLEASRVIIGGGLFISLLLYVLNAVFGLMD